MAKKSKRVEFPDWAVSSHSQSRRLPLTTKSHGQLRKFIEQIDEYTEPKNMSKKSALEFLEQMSTELESRMEGLREELQGGDE